MTPSAKAIIESVQPYTTPTPDDTILSVLNEYDNADKHRLLVVVAALADVAEKIKIGSDPVIAAREGRVGESPEIVGFGPFGPKQLSRSGVPVFNHVAYLLANDINNGGTINLNSFDPVTGRSMLHIENGALAKFTGVQEADRAKFASYDGSYIGEEVTFGGGQGGAVALGTLVQTVYHRAGLMMQNVREIGVAVGTDRSQTVVMELGLKTNQSVASDYVGVYPSNGQTRVALHAYVEAPNPFPELSTATDDFPTKTSFPVSVSVANGNTIAVTSFTVTEAGQSTPIDARLLTRANDQNHYLSSNVAFLVGKAAFKSTTTYNVKFTGTNNGATFTKEWSFTTR